MTPKITNFFRSSSSSSSSSAKKNDNNNNSTKEIKQPPTTRTEYPNQDAYQGDESVPIRSLDNDGMYQDYSTTTSSSSLSSSRRVSCTSSIDDFVSPKRRKVETTTSSIAPTTSAFFTRKQSTVSNATTTTPKTSTKELSKNVQSLIASLSDSIDDCCTSNNAPIVSEHDDDDGYDEVKEEKKVDDTTSSSSTSLSDQQQQVKTKLSWNVLLNQHFHSTSFEKLANFIQKERLAGPVYPSPANIWTALNVCSDVSKIKVVIVGQDPYHGYNQAHGLCFSVAPTVSPIPPSLINVYKEIANDTKVEVKFTTVNRPKHGYLLKWAQQGILMLNTVMSVRKGQPNSHSNQGWEQVTDEIIRTVIQHNQSHGIVFLLWGKPAYQKAMNVITKYSSKNNNTNKIEIISTSHPSPLGATKTSTPFLGSKCFSRCNEALIRMGHTPIDWNVD